MSRAGQWDLPVRLAILRAQGIPHHSEDCLPPCDDEKAAPEKEGLLSVQSPGMCARDSVLLSPGSSLESGGTLRICRNQLNQAEQSGEVVLGDLRVGTG